MSPQATLCPHCQTESPDDDELCQFCGQVMYDYSSSPPKEIHQQVAVDKTMPPPLLCPHCQMESPDDDELCRFCGQIMHNYSTPAPKISLQKLLTTGLRTLKTNIRPLTKEELEKLSLPLSDPANPIWYSSPDPLPTILDKDYPWDD